MTVNPRTVVYFFCVEFVICRRGDPSFPRAPAMVHVSTLLIKKKS